MSAIRTSSKFLFCLALTVTPRESFAWVNDSTALGPTYLSPITPAPINRADHAATADQATAANTAITAQSAAHAATADAATTATRATTAGTADLAILADTATNAQNANIAQQAIAAQSAVTAQQAQTAAFATASGTATHANSADTSAATQYAYASLETHLYQTADEANAAAQAAAFAENVAIVGGVFGPNLTGAVAIPFTGEWKTLNQFAIDPTTGSTCITTGGAGFCNSVGTAAYETANVLPAKAVVVNGVTYWAQNLTPAYVAPPASSDPSSGNNGGDSSGAGSGGDGGGSGGGSGGSGF